MSQNLLIKIIFMGYWLQSYSSFVGNRKRLRADNVRFGIKTFSDKKHIL